MKKIYNYIMLLTLAFVAVCCSEEVIDAPTTSAKTGDEVQFGLSLEGASRTVYGNLVEGATSYPIYWVDEDKVQIFSPQCLEGKRSAEYQVSVNNEAQNFATELSKTGENGLQWVEGTHDFYSLYPSGNYTFDKDKMLVSGVEVKTSQVINYVNSTFVHDMSNCLMYASTSKANMEDGPVSLNYNPISTVLWFEVMADKQEAAQDELKKDFTITGIALEEVNKKSIAGTFSLKANNGTFDSWIVGFSSIAVTLWDNSGSQEVSYTIKPGETLKFPIFLAPDESIDIRNLKITINTNNGTFVKTLEYDNTTTENSTVAGKIHKIKLPNLAPTAEGWDVKTWMKYIPRNVYLSEVSIPGTWNSLNSDFQLDQSISNQYALGVRAFHIDTRWKRTGFSYIFGDTYEYSLGTADGGGTSSLSDGKFMTDADNPTFETSLNTITSKVQSDEYMVLFCTFAQNSNNHVENGNYWYDEISRICAENEKVYDASNLTENTVVGDVLGHVIVVVNLSSSVSSVALPENSKCLFTYVPMELPSDHYATTTSHIDNLYYGTGETSGISMYTTHAQISTTNTSAVNCGDRGYSHPLTSRDNLVKSFWDLSKNNYGTTNYNHDKWIYTGLGGYIMDSPNSDESGYETIENRYAPMIYDRIKEMGQNNVPYYPLGIILMNNKKGDNYTDSSDTDLGYGFSDVCKEILLLNNKYRLQYDPSKPSDYKPSALSVTNYSATATNGGNAFDTK